MELVSEVLRAKRPPGTGSFDLGVIVKKYSMEYSMQVLAGCGACVGPGMRFVRSVSKDYMGDSTKKTWRDRGCHGTCESATVQQSPA